MKSVLVFAALFVLGLVVQGAVIRGASSALPAPDIIAALVVYLALRYRSLTGLVAAFSLGLFGDFGSAQLLGAQAAGAVCAFWFIVMLSEKVFAEKGLAVFLLGAIASTVKSSVDLLFLFLFTAPDFELVSTGRLILIQAFGTGVVSLVVMKLLVRTTAGASRRSVSGSIRS